MPAWPPRSTADSTVPSTAATFSRALHSSRLRHRPPRDFSSLRKPFATFPYRPRSTPPCHHARHTAIHRGVWGVRPTLNPTAAGGRAAVKVFEPPPPCRRVPCTTGVTMRASTVLHPDNNLCQCPAEDLECLERWLGATVYRLENATG